MTHKQCKKCNATKPLTEYYFYQDRQDYGSACKVCRRKDAKEYGKINKEKISEKKKQYRKDNSDLIKQKDKDRYHKYKDRYRNKYLKNTYGITQDELDKMISDQDGKCAICFSKPDDRPLCIDHCHTSGNVRKLLCHSCNTGIGLLKEDPVIMASAIKYLLQFSAV